MMSVLTLLYPFAHSAELLVPLVVAGVFVGEWVAHYAGVNAALVWVSHTAKHMARKLNRPNRSIATRLYRGIVALLLLLIPTLLVGILLSDIAPLAILCMIALIGRAFTSRRLLQRWRAARTGTLGLEITETDFLFADTHAVLRYTILTSAESFAVGVVGVCVWYVIGGIPFALAYLVLAEIAHAHTVPVFGWAATALFRLVNSAPKLLSLLLLTVAAIFIPRTRPLAIGRTSFFHGAIAALLGISLGGTVADRELPWVGTGTPKLQAEHLARWLLLRLTATVLLLLTLSSLEIVKLLKIFI